MGTCQSSQIIERRTTSHDISAELMQYIPNAITFIRSINVGLSPQIYCDTITTLCIIRNNQQHIIRQTLYFTPWIQRYLAGDNPPGENMKDVPYYLNEIAWIENFIVEHHSIRAEYTCSPWLLHSLDVLPPAYIYHHKYGTKLTGPIEHPPPSY